MIDPPFPRKRTLPRPLFAVESPWNKVAGTVVPQEINRLYQSCTIKVLGERVVAAVNSHAFAFPIYTVDQVTRRESILVRPYKEEAFTPSWYLRNSSGSNTILLEVPVPTCRFQSAPPVGIESDGTIVIYDSEHRTEYDFWQVTNSSTPGGGQTGDQILSVGSVAAFNLDELGYRHERNDPPNSSRASGLPYLGGLLVPEDLAEGPESVIKHALAVVLPRLRFLAGRQDPPNWVFPASNTETCEGNPNEFALAAGQRIVLADYLYAQNGENLPTDELLNNKRIPPIVTMFLRVLYDYGAFIVDAGDGFSFAAEDVATANPIWCASEVSDLTRIPKSELSKDETAWGIVMNTLNEYLSHLLFGGVGLDFGVVVEGELHYNFDVIEDAT